jgi:triosephosphate isomerase
MHVFIRKQLSEKYGQKIAEEFSILYGGSVNSKNSGELFGCEDIDGALVGGASLKAQEFLSIIRSMSVVKQ